MYIVPILLLSFCFFIESTDNTQKKSALISCLQEHEKAPCRTSDEFIILKEYYTEALQLARNKDDALKWGARLNQCYNRLELMLNIETIKQAARRNATSYNVTEGIHWQALRDTYPPHTVHYAYYDEQHIQIQQRFKIKTLTDIVSSASRRKDFSQTDYLHLRKKAEQMFGEQAETTLSQIPGFMKLVMHSIAKTFYAQSAPQKECSLRSFYYDRACDETNDFEHKAYQDRNQRQKRLRQQIDAFDAPIEYLEEIYALKNLIGQLRDTYAPVDHENRDTCDWETSFIDRAIFYQLNDLDALKTADHADLEINRKQFTQTIITRLEKRDDLDKLFAKSPSLKEKRNAYLELLSTYSEENKDDDHAFLVNKILRIDIKRSISKLEESSSNDQLASIIKLLSLNKLLLEIISKDKIKHAWIIKEIEMLQALKIYTEAHNHTQLKIDLPINEENVQRLHSLVSGLYSYALDVNEKHATTIETEWMLTKLAAYEAYMHHYKTIDELKEALISDVCVENKMSLLHKVIGSPITEPKMKKEYLIHLIDLTEDVSSKIKLIRDDLLNAGLLTESEQIQWHKKLAEQYRTRKIRAIRTQLDNTCNADEQIRLNKELATCYAQRKALEKE